MSGIPNLSTKIVPPKKTFNETGSCFDTTGKVNPKRYSESDVQRDHESITKAFSLSKPVQKPTTSEYLKKGSGFGGMSETAKIKKRDDQTPAPVTPKKSQPMAYKEKPNPPDTAFRRFFERGDLPIQVDHGGVRNMIAWKVDITKLDFHHYLPIFFDGLREMEEPYCFLAEQGIKDMLINACTKVLPVIPQLIIPIKNALNIKNKAVIVKSLNILQLLITCDTNIPPEQGGGLIGQALVPYYRQILPVLNIFIRKNENLGDGIDYAQRKNENLGDLIQQTLELLEKHGGDDAFINIKYLVPTYQSVTIG